MPLTTMDVCHSLKLLRAVERLSNLSNNQRQPRTTINFHLLYHCHCHKTNNKRQCLHRIINLNFTTNTYTITMQLSMTFTTVFCQMLNIFIQANTIMMEKWKARLRCCLMPSLEGTVSRPILLNSNKYTYINIGLLYTYIHTYILSIYDHQIILCTCSCRPMRVYIIFLR